MLGKRVIEGTRITVELVLEKLGAGESVDQILSAHPHLTEEGINAARAFAAHTLRLTLACLETSAYIRTCRRFETAPPASDEARSV
jgi:uncharacterized protein (DUF433 family)